jgi:hypothetical protein
VLLLSLRVLKPFLPLEPHDDISTFCTSSVGTIISTDADLLPPGLVPLSMRGQNLSAFARDINEHTRALILVRRCAVRR